MKARGWVASGTMPCLAFTRPWVQITSTAKQNTETNRRTALPPKSSLGKSIPISLRKVAEFKGKLGCGCRRPLEMAFSHSSVLCTTSRPLILSITSPSWELPDMRGSGFSPHQAPLSPALHRVLPSFYLFTPLALQRSVPQPAPHLKLTLPTAGSSHLRLPCWPLLSPVLFAYLSSLSIMSFSGWALGFFLFTTDPDDFSSVSEAIPTSDSSLSLG